MKRLTFINALGAELVFTNSTPLLLEEFTEDESVNIYSSKGVNQDGASYLDNTLDVKDISLKFNMITSSEEELIRLRNKVYNVFNPKLEEGVLVYKDAVNERKIKCLISKKPSFSNFNICVSRGLISLTANDPYWTELSEKRVEIASWKGLFEFPLALHAGGQELGRRFASTVVNIVNPGDIECGFRIEFKALSTVINPSLIHLATGQYITINKTLEAGEVITVLTTFNNKEVNSTISGIVTNAFNFIDWGSTFFLLRSGDNLLQYGASYGESNLEVTIYYLPMYLGV